MTFEIELVVNKSNDRPYHCRLVQDLEIVWTTSPYATEAEALETLVLLPGETRYIQKPNDGAAALVNSGRVYPIIVTDHTPAGWYDPKGVPENGKPLPE